MLKINILNVPEEEVEKLLKKYDGGKDTFELFLNIGRDYMKKYKTKPVDINSKEGQEEVRRIMFALIEELMEFANTLKNKKWCNSDYPVDEQHMLEELADAWAFWIQLLLLLDFNKDNFKRLYISKLIVNEFRLRSEY